MNVPAESVPSPSQDYNYDRGTIICARVVLILHVLLLLWGTAQVLCAIIGFSINTFTLAAFLIYFCLSTAQISFGKIALEEEDESASIISSYFTAAVFTIELILLIISIVLLVTEKDLPTEDPLFPLGVQFVVLIIISLISHLCSFLLFYFNVHEYLEKINEC